MENTNKIVKNEITPNGDVTTININKTDIQIDSDSIFIVLENTINSKFTEIDFSSLQNEKDVLEYFYKGEDECICWINRNFEKQYSLKKFYKSLIYESIKQKYFNINEISKIRNSIQLKLEKITKEIEDNQIIVISDLLQIYNKKFQTEKIPKFLSKEHYKSVKSIMYSIDFDTKFDEIFMKDEFLSLIPCYFKLVSKEIKPFEFVIDNKNFFKLFLLSNYKDIYKSPTIKKIFVDNYEIIVKSFLLDSIEMKSEFESIINNNKFDCLYIETEIKKLMEKFNLMRNQNTIFHIISSYFYLVVNIMKDTSRDSLILNFSNEEIQIINKFILVNINNPYLNKLLSNLTNSLTKYSTNAKYNYPSLINSFNAFLINNSVLPEFECYNIKDIENSIYNSKINGLDKNKFDTLKEKINSLERCDSITGILYNQVLKNVFKSSGSDSNIFSLFPLNKRVYSNTITIFITGFLSEKKDFIKYWKKFIDYDSRFSNFFFFRWPSYSFSDIFFRNLPKMFKDAKLKAKYSGKILGEFLASNEIFNNFQINLVGHSLGCHVIKNCLKELNEIKGNKILINNVIFMAGATTLNNNKWPNIFQNVVGGRIINCYSKMDDVLTKLYKLCTINNAIGSDELIIKDEKGNFDYVENYDFSDLNLGHREYKKNFEKILKRIDFY